MKIYGDPEVPFLAQDWHDGQSDPLYALASAGWPQELEHVKDALHNAKLAKRDFNRKIKSAVSSGRFGTRTKEDDEAEESIDGLIEGLEESIKRKSKKPWY